MPEPFVGGRQGVADPRDAESTVVAADVSQ